MGATLNFKKRKFISKREVIVIISAIILTTVGIKASDNFFNSEEPVVDEGRCPQDMVLVTYSRGDFCIDKYEAAPNANCPINNPANQTETRTNLDFRECGPTSKEGVKPWRNISQDQAAIACAKAGKRLPTNEEWYAAVLGTPDAESGWASDDCNVNSNWGDSPGLSGSGVNCVSSAGAYDMVGNVWEWVEGVAEDGIFNGGELPDNGYVDSTDGKSFPGSTNANEPNPNYNEDYFWIKKNGLRGIARGGYWGNKSDAGQYSVYIVTPPSYVGVGIGFRCAK